MRASTLIQELRSSHYHTLVLSPGPIETATEIVVKSRKKFPKGGGVGGWVVNCMGKIPINPVFVVVESLPKRYVDFCWKVLTRCAGVVQKLELTIFYFKYKDLIMISKVDKLPFSSFSFFFPFRKTRSGKTSGHSVDGARSAIRLSLNLCNPRCTP